METYCFDPKAAASIEAHSSRKAAVCPIANTVANAQIAFLYIAAGGLVGYHQAVSDQLFLVVEGSGWVAGADRQKQAITAGHAALWRSGEWHESGTDTGMTVVVVEAEAIDLTMWD